MSVQSTSFAVLASLIVLASAACTVTTSAPNSDPANPAAATGGGQAPSPSPATPGDGGQAPSAPSANGGGGGTSPGAAPLTCASYAWCGSGSVKIYQGQTLPTARGGTIPDGLYRLGYLVSEKGTGTEFGEYGSAFLFRNGSVRTLGTLPSVGTFTTAQGKLATVTTSNCNDETGAATSASTDTDSRDYLVDAKGQLFLFDPSNGSNGAQTASVYLPETTLCGGIPQTVPATPGDSFICDVSNCGCTESNSGPADDSVCKFVNGN